MQIFPQNKIKNFELPQVYLLRCEVEHWEKQLNRIRHVINISSICGADNCYLVSVCNQLITYHSDCPRQPGNLNRCLQHLLHVKMLVWLCWCRLEFGRYPVRFLLKSLPLRFSYFSSVLPWKIQGNCVRPQPPLFRSFPIIQSLDLAPTASYSSPRDEAHISIYRIS